MHQFSNAFKDYYHTASRSLFESTGDQPSVSLLSRGTPDQRIRSLDFLRGLAAFSVMAFHFTAESSIELSDQNPLRVIGVYGHFGVDVFFIISGLVIPYSMYQGSYSINSFGKFLLKRTLRLEVPFLVLIALEVLLIYLSSLTTLRSGISERLDGSNIVLHIAYLNGILNKPWLLPIFWTLAIEFQFYLLMAIIFPMFSKSNFMIRSSTVAALALLSFLLPHPNLFFRYGTLFLIGIILFQLVCNVINRREFIIVSTGLLFLVYLQHGLISFLISIVTVALILTIKGDWRWSNFLGMISYSLYLIHIPFGGRLLVLTNMYVTSEMIRSALMIGYLGLTILVAWLFFLFVEKPSLLLSKRIFYKKSLRSDRATSSIKS